MKLNCGYDEIKLWLIIYDEKIVAHIYDDTFCFTIKIIALLWHYNCSHTYTYFPHTPHTHGHKQIHKVKNKQVKHGTKQIKTLI
jgi:hypothetical protein